MLTFRYTLRSAFSSGWRCAPLAAGAVLFFDPYVCSLLKIMTGSLQTLTPLEGLLAALSALTGGAAILMHIHQRRSRAVAEKIFGARFQQDAYLRLMVRQLPAILWATDTQLRITASAGTGLAALRLQPEQVEGLTLFEYLKTKDPNFLPITAHTRALQGEAAHFEIDLQHHTFDCFVEPLRAESGEIIGAVGIALDVTARRQAERELAQSRRQYDELVHSIEGIVWEADASTLQFTFVSNQAERLLGYPVRRWLEEPNFWKEHLHPEDRDWDLSFILATDTVKRPHEFEQRMLAADGRTLWVRNFVTTVKENGVPVKLRGLMVNNSERRLLVNELRTAHKALEEAHSQLAAIIEQAPAVAIQGYGADGTVTFWNRASEELYGFKAENVIGKNLGEFLLSPGAAKDFEEMVRVALATNAPAPVREWSMATAAGTACNVMSSLFPIRFGQNRTQVICMDVDITARKRTEEVLQASKERYRRLLETTNVIPWEAEPRDRRFTYVGPQCVKVLGYPREAWYQENFWRDHILEEDRERAAQRCQEMALQQGEYDLEYRMLAADGRVFWFRDLVSVMRGDDGPESLRGFLIDITEQKRGRDALLASQGRLTLLSHLAKQIASGTLFEDIVAHTVKELGLHFTHLRVFHATLNDEGQLRVLQSVEPPNMPALTGLVADLTAAPQCLASLRRRELMMVSDLSCDDRVAPLHDFLVAKGTRAILHVPIHEAEKLIGVLGFDSPVPRDWQDHELATLREITEYLAIAYKDTRLQQERKRLEEERTTALSVANAELARAARTKDEFLASMSHELRTPLNAVLGISEALRDQVYGAMNEKQQTALRHLEESGRHLLALINDILDLSKIEAGKLRLEIAPLAVEAVCSASLRLFTQMALEKRLKISCQQDEQVTLILADERRLKQILVNLLSNAVKFTPAGGEIGLEVRGDVEKGVVRFSVWDTGIGISMADIVKLFQPFVQLDSTLARQYPGTGLGLVLVHRMVELHGGGVMIDSKPGKGSRFTVILPWLKPVAPAVIESAWPAEPPNSHEGVFHRALIIDEPSPEIDKLQEYLRELDLETRISSPQEEIGPVLRIAQPDIIFLNILLADALGWKVLTQLKLEPRTQVLPVIIISERDTRAQGLSLGAAEFLSKPISREQLQWVLSKVAFEWPARVAQHAATLEGVVAPAGQPPRLLLVEDSESNINTLFDYLMARQYRVQVARTGREAVQRAQTEKPDLILMDIRLPGENGLETMRKMKKDESLRAVPMIALTALAMPGDRERCLEAGANDYLSKPVSMKDLVEAIEKQLQNNKNFHTADVG
ncbi:MAG: PAS domain S-box protein [bacterium]